LKVLVTGSAGRIGRRVVALLQSRGDTVTGFDRVSLVTISAIAIG
jgi:nucleoside-diphosphate-sugar epimerase